MTHGHQSRLNRKGSVASTLALIAGVVLIAGFIAHFFVGGITGTISGFFDDTPTVKLLTAQVTEGPFEHSVLERGEVESSSNIEVRSQVRGRTSSSAVSILEIVPEGSRVEKGDFLVKLDDSELQTRLIQQQIVCSNSEATVIEAKANLESAKLTLSEYDEGTFQEKLAQQQSEVFVAEENKRRAEEYLTYSKRLAERGYIPEAQLEADSFGLEKAKKELGVANTKLKVLSKFTRNKMLTQFKADIETAQARLTSRQKTWQLDKFQLAEIEEQISKCVINAPVAGQVVYANNQSRSSSSTVLIEEGMPVRERQVIINLPDPKKMRVTAKVHESRIGFVQKGQVATLRFDAMTEAPLSGTVTSVSEYPLPAISIYSAHVKEYEVQIQIDDPPADLRPGMTAEVNVLVQKIDNAVQVPIESVIERDGRFFCAVPDGEGNVLTRELEIGSVNETELVIHNGLDVGEEVVLNVSDADVIALLDLPADS